MVSGVKILGSCEKTTRNHLIMSISLGIGIGVGNVPHMLSGGGSASFYGGVMEMNMGAMPLKDACVPGTEQFYSETFPGSFDYFASSDLGELDGVNGMLNSSQGFHVGKLLLNPNTWVECCDFDESKKAWRTAFKVMFNTPYCIGFLAAVLLNLLLPTDIDVASGVATPPAKTAPEDTVSA